MKKLLCEWCFRNIEDNDKDKIPFVRLYFEKRNFHLNGCDYEDRNNGSPIIGEYDFHRECAHEISNVIDEMPEVVRQEIESTLLKEAIAE